MKNRFNPLYSSENKEGETSACCSGTYEERCPDEVGGSAGNGGAENIQSHDNSKMLRTAGIPLIVRKIKSLFNICDLPIRKKFFFYSLGATFWILVISAIGLITMFDMSSKSQQMVERIWPQEKTANIVIRKLRGANISVHNITIFTDADAVHGDFRRAKGTLADSRLYLNTLLQGGQIADHMLATDQFSEPYRVLPVRAAEKREAIGRAMAKILELDKLVDKVYIDAQGDGEKLTAFRDPNTRKVLIDTISRYDTITRDAVTMLNDYAIGVSQEWGRFSSLMRYRFNLAILLISITLFFTLALAVFYWKLMSGAFERHLNAMIGQIRALSSGELDLTKKIDQTSKDELGSLSVELNKLIDTIGNVTTFKKVIEGDESTEDIYMRLGKIFDTELGIDDCVVYEISGNKKTMEIVYPTSGGLRMHCRGEVQLDCELCRAKRTGLLVSSRDFTDVCRYFTGSDGDGHLCIPVVLGGNVGGVVQLVCRGVNNCDRAILERKITKAQQYLREAQPVLEAKRLMRTLKESSLRDGLTGFYNRRFLEECSENLVAGAQRRKSTLGLLMCDLDYFKETNDVYGHDVGDKVLKETSSVIRKSVRASDMAVRFGGEEFLLVLTETSSEGILVLAEKIRTAVEETRVNVPGGSIKKTISIGASELPGDTQNFWEAIKFADVALYKAKEAGRNKVLKFTRDMWNQDRY